MTDEILEKLKNIKSDDPKVVFKEYLKALAENYKRKKGTPCKFCGSKTCQGECLIK